MSFFRREKDPVEEFRRSREGLSRVMRDAQPGQPLTNGDTTPSPSDLIPPPTAADPEDTHPQQDLMQRLRQGATTVVRDTFFSGTLRSDSNLLIEGRFEGQLEAHETIFIAQGAEVKADVRATDVIVAGTMDGTVEASGLFHAMPSARVAGQIHTALLVVDPDSHVSCRFSMQPRGEAKG